MFAMIEYPTSLAISFDQDIRSLSAAPISNRSVPANSERIGSNCCCAEPISYLGLESASAIATTECLASGDTGLLFLMLRS